ncbi:MAG: methyltransferase domain-containing protein [Pseudomonadota bacterium]
MTDNANEQEFWSGPAGQSWIKNEAEQDGLLSNVAHAAIEIAALQPGMRVLDIGCGAGALTILAAEAVGDKGRVLATDIAPPFVERVGQRAAGLPQVGTFQGDAQTADWPESGFDIAVSRFGVMFFADPSAAFANIARALRPGGRIVFAAWARVEDNPYWSIPRDLIADRFGPQQHSVPNTPGPMGLADAEWAAAQFRVAGLVNVDVTTREVALTHPGGAAGAASQLIQIGPAVRALAENDLRDAEVEAFRQDAEQAFLPFEVDGLAHIPATIHFFTAERL